MLVHRTDGPVLTIRPLLSQRLQDLRDQPPTHRYPFDGDTTPDITPQHDHKLVPQLLRGPRHLDPGLHLVDALQALSAMVVLQHQRPVTLDVDDTR